MRFVMFFSYQYNHECLVQLVTTSDLSRFFNQILSYYLSFLMKDDHVILMSMHSPHKDINGDVCFDITITEALPQQTT